MLLNPYRKIKELEKEIQDIKNRELDPLTYVRKIIKNLEWFDYEKLGKQHWTNYYNDAQQIVKSDVFKNEINKFISEITKDIALESRDHIETTNKRTGIVFLESFADRLEAIKDPRVMESKEEIFEAV